MPESGHRHRLLIYIYTINRWWRLLLGIGIGLLLLVAAASLLPLALPRFPILRIEDRLLWLLGGMGGLAIFLCAFLVAIRKVAYVQPLSDHLRLVTPFLRLNISYRRIRQAYSSEMRLLFPIEGARGWKRKFLRPLAKHTAIVLELNGLPASRAALRLFLSPFFFPDQTARLVLLVPDWMKLSNEMESLRSLWQDSLRETVSDPASVVLSSLSKSKK